ncbi:MAG: pyridoxal-phosphate-dependent aminotransferase family protein, partial [Planctomycetaceae bacterium]
TEGHSRTGTIFRGLVNHLVEYCLERDHDLLLISGTVRQAKLYEHLGFTPFGPLVGSGEALYQPMYLTLDAFLRNEKVFPALRAAVRKRRGEALNFLPGPVAVSEPVRAAFARPPVSHRSPQFAETVRTVQRRLCELAGAKSVQIMMGTGSLANDAVAAQLSLLDQPGLIVVNGAFGERLVDHALRFGLRFDTAERPWGQRIDRDVLERALDAAPETRWLWAVHGETSTGVLNDLEMLKSIAAARDLRLCIDAVSSLGSVPLNLEGAWLASSVSGKGLGSFSGLALVFHQDELAAQPGRLPRYLDIGFYAESHGVPFTMSSNLLDALHTAVEQFEGARHFRRLERLASELRRGLEELRLPIVADPPSFPAIVTIQLPAGTSSTAFGEQLERTGHHLHYRSEYLRSRNWIQICLMGVCTPEMVEELLFVLRGATEG